ncbi:homolog of yeast ADA2 2A, partial [Prunus dulcis]
MKKIWLSMFYSIRVGEEPDSNQVKMIRVNSFFLRQRSYHFRRNWSYISFPFPFKSSYVFPRPSRPRKMDNFLFLGTHTRFVTTKRIMRLTPLLLSCYNPLPAEPPFLLGPQRQNVGLVPTVHHGRKDSLSRDH